MVDFQAKGPRALQFLTAIFLNPSPTSGTAFRLRLDVLQGFIFFVDSVLNSSLVLNASLTCMPRPIAGHASLRSALMTYADVGWIADS